MKNSMESEDQFLRDLFQSNDTRPSVDFTELVTKQIDQGTELFKYKPPIASKTWVVIGSSFAVLLIYLIVQASTPTWQASEVYQFMKNGFFAVGNGLAIDFSGMQLPEIPTPILMAIGALNVIGVYLMVSYRWARGMFM
ncbi:MAG: hypothetical protein JXQ96_15950 [Cyclobacteriaceae bacterium]